MFYLTHVQNQHETEEGLMQIFWLLDYKKELCITTSLSHVNDSMHFLMWPLHHFNLGRSSFSEVSLAA